MIGGGEIYKLEPSTTQDTSNNSKIDAGELKVSKDGTELSASDVANLSTDAWVDYRGMKFRWAELRSEILNQTLTAAGKSLQADNVEPSKIYDNIKNAKVTKASELYSQIRDLKDAKDRITGENADAKKRTKQTEIDNKTRELAKVLQQLQQLNMQNGKDKNAGIDDPHWLSEAGMSSGESGGGGGEFRAEVTSPQAQPYGSGQGGQGAGGGGGGAKGLGVGPGGGFGPDGFGSLTPPTSLAYALAMDYDAALGDGFASIGKSRREGQRLMMLFFYYARMAEPGDLGAMYQFIKFINYIIAKDKARQNIQISSKLIQLQDLSRKATDALMATPAGDDTKSQTEFTKAMHKARSEEATISTSQKLLADMLQEFAHVVEALTNSVKNMLDAWGRVMRTASAR